jgi:hypothetical protein
MRRFAARLAGLALVTGLAAIVSTAGAAPPDGSKANASSAAPRRRGGI